MAYNINTIHKYIHYKSKRSSGNMIRTACGASSSIPLKVTRNKNKVTCKRCRKRKEFKQKTMWQKFWKRIKWQ